MVIFVTDNGLIWNHKNPILDKYAKYVVVVCLNGQAATDKYRCVVIPHRVNGLGMTGFHTIYSALAEHKEELLSCFSYDDDIIFLTDNEPTSLFPYLVLKNDCGNHQLHLWSMSPFPFEAKARLNAYFEMLQNTDTLTSLLYLDTKKFLKSIPPTITVPDLFSYYRDYLSELLPAALYEINTLLERDKKYFYDFTSQSYVSTKDPYLKLLEEKPIRKETSNVFPSETVFMKMAMLPPPKYYPSSDEETKCIVEQLYPRIDGKAICDKLKKMRQELADQNNISFETIPCPFTGPCAGTCEQCDKELAYLKNELLKIPVKDRKYPTLYI